MKKLAITIGDPGGVGPEIALKAVLRLRKKFAPLIIGDRIVIEKAMGLLKDSEARALRLAMEFLRPDECSSILSSPSDFTVYCISAGMLEDLRPGQATREGGHASVQYIKLATELAMKGVVHAIVTAPISKTSLKMAGYPWPGHTEMLKELTGAEDVAMLFYAPPTGASRKGLKVLLTTIHVALREVPALITEERVFKSIVFANTAAQLFGINSPRIGVAGLNPHAGEEGIFGDEDIKVIAPAVRKAREEGLNVYGPIPPDVIFYKALHGEYDIVVSMYHDQGLAPLKLIAFERAVNITVGLPIIRTSPDHGTAYDIAWRGIANPSSMIEAIKVALRLKNRLKA